MNVQRLLVSSLVLALAACSNGGGDGDSGPAAVVTGPSSVTTATAGSDGRDATGDSASEAEATSGPGSPDAAPTGATADAPLIKGDGLLVAGPGNHRVEGGSGNDVLVARAGGWLANGRFDYWDTTVGALPTVDGTSLVFQDSQDSRNDLGWTLGSRPFSTTGEIAAALPTATAPCVALGTGLRRGFAAATDASFPQYTDPGDRYGWLTASPSCRTSNLKQSIVTSPEGSYALTLVTSDPAINAARTSLEVWWNGTVIATFNGNRPDGGWSGTVYPNSFSDGSSRTEWVFSGLVATSGSTTLELVAAADPAAPAGSVGFTIAEVRLESVGQGESLMIGGAGDDVVVPGPGARDVLYGGQYGDTPTTPRTGESNTFVIAIDAAPRATVRDFHLGADRIVVTRVSDYAGPSTTAATEPALTTRRSDDNLDALDIADHQLILAIREDNGDTRLLFRGNRRLPEWPMMYSKTDSATVNFASLTLEGVAYDDLLALANRAGYAGDEAADRAISRFLVGGSDGTGADAVMRLTGDGFRLP